MKGKGRRNDGGGHGTTKGGMTAPFLVMREDSAPPTAHVRPRGHSRTAFFFCAHALIAIMAMVPAGMVEIFRLKRICGCCEDESSLCILWQIPQYVLLGDSEVFMYVVQLEFFGHGIGQAEDLWERSLLVGNYMSSLLVTIAKRMTADGDRPGWIPGNLNGFYFLLAALAGADFVMYLACGLR